MICVIRLRPPLGWWWNKCGLVLQQNKPSIHSGVLNRDQRLVSVSTMAFGREIWQGGMYVNNTSYIHYPRCLLWKSGWMWTSVYKNMFSNAYVRYSKLTTHIEVSDSLPSATDEEDKTKISDFLKKRHPDYLNENSMAVTDMLVKRKLTAERIIQLIVGSPEILTCDPDLLNSCISLLFKYGFSLENVACIIRDFPDIVGTKPEVLSDVMDFLQGLGFNKKQACRIIATCPAVLSVSVQEMQVKYSQIMSLCKKSDTMSIIRNTPSVLVDSWSSIEDRHSYATDVMGMSKAAILRSRMFDYPLQHIQTRHRFLLKAGLFEKPDKHGNTRVENPPAGDIFGHSDETFACEVAGMSLAEYLVFRDLLQEDDHDLFEDDDEISDDNDDSEE